MEVSSLCQRRSIIKSRQFSLSDTIALGLIVGVFVGSNAGYLGSIMVSRHMALVGDALSHVALPGLALGILFNFNPFIGALVFGGNGNSHVVISKINDSLGGSNHRSDYSSWH